MGCCSTKEKIPIHVILSKFKAVDVAMVKRNCRNPQLVIGRVSPTFLYISPITERECVQYRVVVQEFDKSAGSWINRIVEEKCLDFNLCDPKAPNKALVVPGKILKIKINEIEDRSKNPRSAIKSGTNLFVYSDKEELPHNIQELLSRHNFSLVKEVNGLFINKKLRFIETTFVPGELLGVLGHVKDGTVSISGVPIMTLDPIRRDSLSSNFFKRNAWLPKHRNAWVQSTERPCVIATDLRALFQGKAIGLLPVDQLQAEVIDCFVGNNLIQLNKHSIVRHSKSKVNDNDEINDDNDELREAIGTMEDAGSPESKRSKRSKDKNKMQSKSKLSKEKENFLKNDNKSEKSKKASK